MVARIQMQGSQRFHWKAMNLREYKAMTPLVIVALLALFAAPAEARLAARFAAHDPESTIVVDHGAFGDFLSRYLSEGPDGVNRFAYGAVSQDDHQALKDYIASLERVDVSGLNRAEQFAYWANLYNAVTLDVVLDNHPVGSIRDIRSGLFFPGPWRLRLVTVGGEDLSLDNIEHDIMRPILNDPRVHYAVNCASIGCPNLWVEPFAGAALEDQLEHAAKAFVNHPRGARVENGRLHVSSIYHWYKEDFGNTDAGVIEHLKQYAESDLREALEGITRIAVHGYDWALNEPVK
jgi:hypothetical protein